ncbi:MAG TPA: SDR family oxidoreductase [Quisquiliibacterium sp.]|nr:SDR family oxidoreductase [Quisquiliibacterium sp.]
MSNTLIVAGATGLIGAAVVEHFAALPGWRVIALSRRAPALPSGVHHVALDLTDAQACRAAVRASHPGCADATHLVYAALYEQPDVVAGWRDTRQMSVNLAMLRNLMDALEPVARGLRHVTLLQGTKAYGSHVAPVPVPAKERWPRHPHENFYWLQEDLLRARQPGATWHYSILRPHVVLGDAQGSPMNLMAAVGAYAAVMRALGEPLHWPGGGRYVSAGSDSRVIAQAVEFCATQAAAAGQTYNVVNGDVMVWQDLWPSIAAHFGMTPGGDRAMVLARQMPQYEPVWAELVARHGLCSGTLDAFVGRSWQFADRAFAAGVDDPVDVVLSPVKLWQAGFRGCTDTEDAVRYWLARMQRARRLPP